MTLPGSTLAETAVTDLEAAERHPAFDLRASRTTAFESYLSQEEVEAVKALRTALQGDADADLQAAIKAIN